MAAVIRRKTVIIILANISCQSLENPSDPVFFFITIEL